MQETVSSTSDKKYSLASFFAGVGGIELGFENTGEFSTVYANEIDKNAQITYLENFDQTFLDKRDIREVESSDVPDADVMTGGFPCQAFSIAGYRKGFEDDRGELFFELLRLIKDKQPRVVFIENVKNMVSHDHGNTFKVIREALVANGYYISWRVLNSSEYGNVPQNRERIYIVGFKYSNDFKYFDFPEPIKLTKKLEEVVNFDDNVGEEYFYREGKQPFYETLEKEVNSKESIYQWRRKYVRENKSGLIPTLTANMGTGGHNVPIIFTDYGIRKLTPRETFNAQNYPKNYSLPEIAKSHLYKQAGNSVTVSVIERIAEKILYALNRNNDFDEKDSFSEKKFAVIYLEVHGKYSGRSYVVDYLNSKEEVNKFLNKHATTLCPVLNDDQYIKFIKNSKSGKFFMSVEL